MARQADITAIQEHKLPPNTAKTIEVQFMGKWLQPDVWTCRPDWLQTCRRSLSHLPKTIAAVKDHFDDETLKAASQEVRLEIFLVDLGWGEHIVLYSIYGRTGGAAEAKIYNEMLMAQIDHEVWSSPARPALVMGDINSDPEDL